MENIKLMEITRKRSWKSPWKSHEFKNCRSGRHPVFTYVRTEDQVSALCELLFWISHILIIQYLLVFARLSHSPSRLQEYCVSKCQNTIKNVDILQLLYFLWQKCELLVLSSIQIKIVLQDSYLILRQFHSCSCNPSFRLISVSSLL